MKISKTYQYLTYAFIASLLLGLLCNFFYDRSPKQSLNISSFTAELAKKEKAADQTLNHLTRIINYNSVDSLSNYNFAKNDIYYFVFEKDELIFWSDNHIEPTEITTSDSIRWHYNKLSNAHCIVKSETTDSKVLMAVILLKYNYPYENKDLINSYCKGFHLDKRVEIVEGNKNDKYAVSDAQNNYLFTLSNADTQIYSEFWGFTGFIFITIAVLLFLFLYANCTVFWGVNTLSLKKFSIATLLAGFAVGLSLSLSFPDLLYWNKLFSSFEYSSNPLLATIGHLVFTTLFLLVANYLFFFRTNIGSGRQLTKAILLQTLFVVYFLIVLYFLSSLVYHSSIQLSILQFNHLSILSIVLHLLIFIWGIGLALLFYKSHNWLRSQHILNKAIIIDISLVIFTGITLFIFGVTTAFQIIISIVIIFVVFYIAYILKRRISIYAFSFLWIFVYVSFFIINAYLIGEEKDKAKYRILAENIYINGSSENDRMADILLEELDSQISSDRLLKNLSTSSDSALKINKYINENYLRGFWNKYEMRLSVAYRNSSLSGQYTDFIEREATKIKNTHFYSVPSSLNLMSYLGVFPTVSIEKDSLYLYMEFYPRKNFKSYSFPNLLISSAPDIQSLLKIAVAKYNNQQLVYSSEKDVFPNHSAWIPARNSNYYSTNYQNRVYYVYQPDKSNYIVISKISSYTFTSYVLYFGYSFLIFYCLTIVIIWLYNQRRLKSKFHIGLTTKFQYAFIILLIISFLGIFYVSVNFIQKKYEDEQISNIENKKNYIQKALQDMYYWSQDLSTVSPQGLNFDLQELSYMYQTDIHVYDNNGKLIGSSQPLIFNKNLISRQISPIPFFSGNTNINQDEHIGELKYLSGYTDFYNGDYLQLGYIAVPQFLSQEETRKEIEEFLSVIIHIYLIIIVFAIFLSIFIGRQLSAPLKMIENKLKKMRFGHRNEKIDYQLNDEIGQLVAQYNRTIDELEKSAKLLAQSEREKAWKTMARQIAHEINNPLTPMKLTIQQLQRTKKIGSEGFDEYFEKSTVTLIEQIDNLSRIAGTFSNFARIPEAHFTNVDVAAKLYSVVQLFKHNNEQVLIIFEGEAKGIIVLADPEQLTQVFNNLLKNAIQSITSDKAGLIKVRIHKVEKEVVIEIEDNGIGIADEFIDKLFTPNFTTKSTGMGLGLTISKNIIEITGGKINFTTRKNEGTTFIISLPSDN